MDLMVGPGKCLLGFFPLKFNCQTSFGHRLALPCTYVDTTRGLPFGPFARPLAVRDLGPAAWTSRTHGPSDPAVPASLLFTEWAERLASGL